MVKKDTKKIKKICSACGTSPTNHKFLFISNLIEEFAREVGEKIFNFKLLDSSQWPATFVEKRLYDFFSLIGIVRYNTDSSKAYTDRSKIIWEEAKRRGIFIEQVVIGKKYSDFYRAKINGNIFYFQSIPIPPKIPQRGYRWLDDKFILSKILSRNEVPVPAAKKISSWKNAKRAFEALQKPVIIKPKYGSRGRHTTTNINTEEELKKAFYLARQITPWMIIQEHLIGSVYRATVINNELVGFFRADPPQVTGDGSKKIRELIHEKNNTRNERLSVILINDDLINFLKRLEYTLESVLPKGITINLSAKTGRMYGGYTKEMLDEVHPKMHSIFKKAGKLVQAPVVGFDLIIPDPKNDPDLQHWGIIECNSLPFIDLHYFALEGEVINLAKNIWDLWDIKENRKELN
jgi:D-alanine-D-alanine ligase-like ATP-grasp enzyme